MPTLLVTRRDGSNGDPGFGPVYPFKMRGSVDSGGNVLLAPGEGNVSSTTNTYAIRVPVLTNAPFDILFRSDASAVNMLVKMDGGLDLNSQMGFAPTNGVDRRDNKPGYTSDVFLGYEQAQEQFLAPLAEWKTESGIPTVIRLRGGSASPQTERRIPDAGPRDPDPRHADLARAVGVLRACGVRIQRAFSPELPRISAARPDSRACLDRV